jgi:hypothetical protein
MRNYEKVCEGMSKSAKSRESVTKTEKALVSLLKA